MANYIIQKNNLIAIYKGDTVDLKFGIEEPWEAGDLALFRVFRPNSTTVEVERMENIEDIVDSEGNIHIHLSSLETSGLNLGLHYYTLKLMKENSEENEMVTLIPKTKFTVLE